ncbi:hypothetical protein RhiirC2_786399 [Rhizophagus irregularis]|uniref:Uncharacterized protein n=1 Tax=Rhizophagus irregularis TaxID=588596 RepID=A0A2N1MUG5_9GLOM|nr:hypothetical protein RhiirC2_786399 [Rhizophagus irregularis]
MQCENYQAFLKKSGNLFINFYIIFNNIGFITTLLINKPEILRKSEGLIAISICTRGV